MSSLLSRTASGPLSFHYVHSQVSKQRNGHVPQAAAVHEAPAVAQPKVLSHTSYDGGIDVDAVKADGKYEVTVTAHQARPMVLHWAVNDWECPPESAWPQNTNKVDDKAVQSRFQDGRSVKITFSEANCPSRVVFVLKELEPENWLNNNGPGYAVQLKAPDLSSVVNKVIAAESEYTHWSLFNRFILLNEITDAAEAAGGAGFAFLYTWMRLSNQKQLDWYRNSNYQSKDIAHLQKCVAQRMADKARTADDPWCRLYARLTLGMLPRGGGDGDAIRHGILNVMRENGIREGHRPGIDEPFLEQWHQKLHTNTTPDDVAICEAYLAYLHSNNHDDYWRVLWDNGRITRSMMENMSKPISAWPKHLPHLIGPMQHYLWILKVTHSGASLDTAMEMAKGNLDGDLQWHIYDMLNNRNEWWVPGKIVEIRERLQHVWKQPTSRDVLLLDIALDDYFRLCSERADLRAMSGDDLISMIQLVIKNALITEDLADLRCCLHQWQALSGRGNKWDREWALAALAAAERTQLALSAFMDTIYNQVQPSAKLFGDKCKIDHKYIDNFGEEVVRGQPLFLLSPLLQALQPSLRKTAGVGDWQVVSQQDVTGRLKVIGSLADVQGQVFDEMTVLVAEEVGGMEDIPANVVGVLTRSATDVLSHVAIRARSQQALLATCFDGGEWDAVKTQAGHPVSVTVNAAGHVSVVQLDAASASNGNGNGNGAVKGDVKSAITLAKPRKQEAWVLGEEHFTEDTVGGKSRNLAHLRSHLPDGVQAPTSITLPFGTFERVLELPENTDVAAQLAQLGAELDAAPAGAVPAALAQKRELLAHHLQPCSQLLAALAAAAEKAGLVTAEVAQRMMQPASVEGEGLWSAICQVWASKWNDRAWLNRKASGIPESDLYVAVLLQQVVPAEYAFVLHTANPLTGAANEMFGEVVVGMGESLVGNHPGRALSFVCHDGAAPQLQQLPSKRTALYAPAGGTLIARSDANGEDLKEFAGAGLYDSVPVMALKEQVVDYSGERLWCDAQFQRDLMSQLVALGKSIQNAFGGAPQDIEGVWLNGKLYVVQSRAQVL